MADQIKALEWEGWIRVTAESAGWVVARSTASSNSPAPKLFAARTGELLVIQAGTTARNGSGLSDGQQHWLDVAATVAGVESVNWCPADRHTAYERLTRDPTDA